jgi:hypothetical protein
MIRISLNILLSEFVFHYYTIDFGCRHPFFYGGGCFGWPARLFPGVRLPLGACLC